MADFFFGYDFFISYAHADGNSYPRALAAALEARGYKVFLDEREYPAGEDLRVGTRRMVGKSRYLVLVARDYLVEREEREATNWVRQEVEASLRARRTPVVIDVNGAFSRASPQNQLGRILVDRVFVPEIVDDPDGIPSERVVQKLADGFKATRQDTIRLRWISATALGLLALAAVAIWQAWLAELRRVEAERQRDEALSRLLTIEGQRQMHDAPDTALLLAAEAVRIRPSPAARDLLRSLLLLDPRMNRFLQGGGRPWRLAAFAADASEMMSVGDDGSAAIWRVAGERLQPLPLEKAARELSSIAVAQDGSRAAGGARDGSRVFLWDARTGKLERTLEANHKGPVEGLAFSPDGAALVSGGTYTETFLWSTATGERLAQLDQHKSGVRAIAFAPDGKSVATAAEGGRVVIWGLGGSKPSRRVLEDGVPPFVFALAFSPDGRRLAAGGQGDAVALWRLEEEQPEPVRFSKQHSGEVVQVSFAADGKVLAVRTRDGRVAFYDPSDSRGTSHAPLDAGPGPNGDFAWADGGKALLTIGPGNFARRWNLAGQTGPTIQTLAGHERGTRDIAHGIGNTLFSTGCPGPRAAIMDSGCAFGEEIQRWNLEAAAAKGSAAATDGRKVVRVAARRDGKTLLLVLDGGHLAIWNTAQNRIVEEHPRPKPPPSEEAPKKEPPKASGGAHIPASPSPVPSRRGAAFLRVGGNLPIGPCTIYNTSPDAIAISPRGETVHYGGGRRGCVFQWKDGDGWSPRPLFEGGSAVKAIAVSQDGRSIAIGGDTGTLSMWRLAPAVERAWIEELGRDRTVTALEFSPSGDLLLVGLARYEEAPRKSFFQGGKRVGSAMLWSATENRLVSPIVTAPPSLGGGPVGSVSFSPDGSLAVVGGCRKEGGLFNFGCDVGDIVLWDIASSRQIGPPVAAHKGAVKRIAWHDDGASLATLAESHTLYSDSRILLWDLRPESWMAAACAMVGRPLTAEEAQRYLGDVPAKACVRAATN